MINSFPISFESIFRIFNSVQKSKRVFLGLFLMIIVLTGCGGSVSSNPSSGSTSSSHRHKLIVFVSGLNSGYKGHHIGGIDTNANNGYGLDVVAWQSLETFFQAQVDSSGVAPFKDAQFIQFSYEGSDSTGKPQPYPCSDTYNHAIYTDVSYLSYQIDNYLRGHPDTDVYLVSHSLGGVITLSYVAHKVEISNSLSLVNAGQLKGVAIEDSPFGGVTRTNGYQDFMVGGTDLLCGSTPQDEINFTTVSQMQTLFGTALDLNNQGQSASVLSTILQGKNISNQQVAEHAAIMGLRIVVAGNTNDLLWRPDVCGVGPAFISTEFLNERDEINGKHVALYSRSFASPAWPLSILDCGAIPITAANHIAVMNDSGVEKLVWEVFTGNIVDQLTPEITIQPVLTPVSTPTGIPQPVPTPTQIPSPTPAPTQPPGTTPVPTQSVPTNLTGTLQQNALTFQVRLEKTQRNSDGSFEGKWFAMINGAEQDVLVNGLIVPFAQSNQYSQLDQQKVQQVEQGAGSNRVLLWFTSYSYDVGSDILLHCEYYSALQQDGVANGTWYAPDGTQGGPFQLHP